MQKNFVLDGILGLVVGDALGVPVELTPREALIDDPVVDMRSKGLHNLPKGSWSDDSSLTLCLAESLVEGIDYDKIMKNFVLWLKTGYMTPFGEAFGIGRTTLRAIEKFEEGVPALDCGGVNESDNGNGSLMRILPIAFAIMDRKIGVQFSITHNVSAVTHAHPISLISCGIYVQFAIELLNHRNLSKIENFQNAMKRCRIYYTHVEDFNEYLNKFRDTFYLSENYDKSPIIKSSGYVIDTLNSALWAFLSTDNYKDCVLKAVNLGEDTDTVGAVAGGLAGTYYGAESIPIDWVESIQCLEDITDICSDLYETLKNVYLHKK